MDKGDIITFLVNSHNKNKSYSKFKYYLSLYFFLGVYSLVSILSPLVWLMLFSDLFFSTGLYAQCNKIIIFSGIVSTAICNFVLPLLVIIKENSKSFIYPCFLYQIYLILYIPATYVALAHLLYAPHYWDKTSHNHTCIR